MKKRTLLYVILSLIFTKTCLGDGNSQVENFNDYVNSPAGPVDNAVKSPSDNNISPIQAVNHKVLKNPDKTGSDKGNSDETDSKQPLKGIPAQWNTCSMDSDCTAAVADCVSWEPLNKKYLNRLSKNLNSCSESIDPGFQPETVCVKKVCKTTDNTTLVSWEEWLSGMQKRSKRPSGAGK